LIKVVLRLLLLNLLHLLLRVMPTRPIILAKQTQNRENNRHHKTRRTHRILSPLKRESIHTKFKTYKEKNCLIFLKLDQIKVYSIIFREYFYTK